MEKSAKLFAESLRAYRKRLGLTQETLAERLGVTPHTIQSYEAGRREPDFTMLDRLADALGVRASDLIKPDDNSLPQIKRDFIAEIVNLSDIEAITLIPGFRTLVDSFRRFHGHKEPKKLKQG